MGRTSTTLAQTPPPPPVAAPLPPIGARNARYADLMLRAIRDELGALEFVTREDLMQLRIFQHVATITRYHEVCTAVQILLTSGRLVAVSRTDLVLPSRRDHYHGDEDAAKRYAAPIWKACRTFKARAFGVMDVVGRWTTDQHLSVNAKRVAVRNGLKALKKEGRLEETDDFSYISKDFN